ncbi:LAQU0S04e03708g1_1 [Lachancea quebecensis]|uniref:LAQU0S04e03708g1_1 n=1 Tax=Lachancea quebecensis TaxID=1654605 RepID=A0A0P1KQE2_9SACH|nr:LAQU0S04e03708g1_1 [Lachancea quebecensis]
MLDKIHVSRSGEFTDSEGKQIQLRGVNLDPTVKYPSVPHSTSHSPLSQPFFDDASKASFVNHPVHLDEVEQHIRNLKELGYNAIRYPFTWESLEHEGPGIYDNEYIDYTIKVLKKIYEVGGIYVYLDPHQDVWSRFSGGSGAPLWTLYCAGLKPQNFEVTEAAILQNAYIDPDSKEEKKPYPKMLWPTNYYRLAAQTMLTLFFGGKKFTPKCIINGQNIQDYLQGKFIDAVMTLYSRIIEKAPEIVAGNCVIGLETMNEPSTGYFTDLDLSQIPKDRKLRKGTTPTAFQSFQLGEGMAVTVDVYDISIIGPRKTGTTRVDPKGQSAWLSKSERDKIDELYNWERSDKWKAGMCIWRLHEVWNMDPKDQAVLRKPNYFAIDPSSGATIDMHYFINNMFLDFYQRYRERFREIDRESFLFLQPPTLQPPPELKHTTLIDEKTIYACHFYDGMSLMFKSWNRIYNVDTLGILRGRYKNPIFSLVFGETNIRKCLRKQLAEMKQEGKDLLGQQVPVFFTEIGMPFDMDDKKAYKNGDFSSQVAAMDALGYALEGSNLSFSLWCYCTENSHKWGDSWNNEDFSIWSKDDMSITQTKTSLDTKLQNDSGFAPSFSTIPHGHISEISLEGEKPVPLFSGIRALNAILRPYPLKLCGQFKSAEFDLAGKEYKLIIDSNAKSDAPNHTLIYLPKIHFPMGQTSIKTTSGTFLYDPDKQILRWSHETGVQSITLHRVSESSEPVSGDPEGCMVM